MSQSVAIGERSVGAGQPCYIIGEIGINHNGDVDTAKRLIDAARIAGCDAVKFQKRTPELCVPESQRDILRETPWGVMTYMDYRTRIEFGADEYDEIDMYCRDRSMTWFVSCWDTESVLFMQRYDLPCFKIASATLTDDTLLGMILEFGRPVILSTGMSTMGQIRHAVGLLNLASLLLAHTTSTYPCQPEEINLRMIGTLMKEFDCPVGYSGHEIGLQISLAAVARGACFIERHITLDRALWGSDQAASVEPQGLIRLVRDIRIIEAALGDGVKRVTEGEQAAMQRLRREN